MKYPTLFNYLKLIPMVEDPKKKVNENFAAAFYKFHKLGERERSKLVITLIVFGKFVRFRKLL